MTRDRTDRAKIDEARGAERSLLGFDVLAGLSVLASPALFGPIEPVSGEAAPRALIGFGIVLAMLIGISIYGYVARDEMDEFVRRTWERACGFAFGATLAVHILWSTAEQALLIRPMSADDSAAALMVSTALAWLWQRYRGGPA